jgi:hypothetical protein
MLKTSRLKPAPELKTMQKINISLKKLATDMVHIAATLYTLLCKNVSLAWSTNVIIGLHYTNMHKYTYKMFHLERIANTVPSQICFGRQYLGA